jgi:flagella basal body P-ring formation protein FlgA
MRNTLLAITMLLAMATAVSAAAPKAALYLPRDVQVSGPAVRLGDIAIVRSDDDELAAKISAVAMGRAPMSRETIPMDRVTIQSRLAACGVRPSQVDITGAETVSIRLRETIVSSEDLLREAQKLLDKQRPGPEGCLWKLTSAPGELSVPGDGDVELQARPAKESPQNHVKIEIAALRDGKELAVAQATYKFVYARRQAVASQDIPAGGTITTENIRIEQVPSETRIGEEFQPPLGQVAVRAIPAGAALRPDMTRSAHAGNVIRRNQPVVMRITGNGFVVTCVGAALQDGRVGDVIMVQNVDNKRTVNARITPDGILEPICEEIPQ